MALVVRKRHLFVHLLLYKRINLPRPARDTHRVTPLKRTVFLSGPGHTAIEWIRQPLFLAFTSCIMNDVPLVAEADQSPMYFVVDSVRVCE